MKNLLIVLAVVILGAGGWYLYTNNANSNVAPEQTMMDTYSAESEAMEPVANESAEMNSGEKTFTMADISTHNSDSSCYTAIRGEVFDLTSWIGQHPGGDDAIRSICGKDGTSAFVGKHGGKAGQEAKLDTFKIGVVAQ